MKKVILALAVVSFAFVACNNGETKADAPAADTTPKVDTPAVTAPVVTDTAAKAPVADTTKK